VKKEDLIAVPTKDKINHGKSDYSRPTEEVSSKQLKIQKSFHCCYNNKLDQDIVNIMKSI